jgi:hypothetical protein
MSNQPQPKSLGRSIQISRKTVRRCGERAVVWIAAAFVRGVSITAHVIKRTSGSRCDMSSVGSHGMDIA